MLISGTVSMRTVNGARIVVWLLGTALLAPAATRAAAPDGQPGAADGRAALEALHAGYDALRAKGAWVTEAVYTYPDDPSLRIDAWRTRASGPALWILAGIHGEEPAGPNALAEEIASVAALAESGVPIVLLPMCNPKAYRNNWRYPNTPDRDWRGGGYSVGDSEYLLPTVKGKAGPRAERPRGAETAALTRYALRMAARYPPLLVLDFHEDELSAEGGYVYWQGRSSAAPLVAGEIVRLLKAAGVPIRAGGKTRFDETIVNGLIGPDGVGSLFNDGSIDELLAAPVVVAEGRRRRGPGAPTAIVVETPAYSGSRLGDRVAGHRAVIRMLKALWQLNGSAA
jgi:hypothetical protein